MTEDGKEIPGGDIDDPNMVIRESQTKLLRHRADDYVAMILGMGAVFILWLLQIVGVY